MPSFDIKSELNTHEVTNGVDQANRVIENRFDFKGTGARFDLSEGKVTLSSQEEFQLHQMLPILKESLAKRGVDLKSLKIESIEVSTGSAKQEILLKEGIDQEIAKKIMQMIKSSKVKVQASVQGDSIRVNGKKRDDLQQVIEMLKEASFDLPLQFENFRD
ncbi:MAG TPA: YajQ family cyclic di-GMP-binding protein [Gammaproteobacteria bacterium]|nr:YajQ family cyclic di-GMP-binding protein [Gammaproteobacteria bacterium]